MAKKAGIKSEKKSIRDNGLKTFSLHSGDAKSQKAMSALAKERPTTPMFSFAPGMTAETLDPETIAQMYLQQALSSSAVPAFTAPVINKVESEYKSLGTETIPLTGTTTVKFRQTLNKLPVYGSLVTVELDEKHKLVGIYASTGSPEKISPVAQISAAEAVKIVAANPSNAKPDVDNVVPRLNYFFDVAKSKWHLAYILEDVPVGPRKATKVPFPVKMDFVIDAHSGKVIAMLNRTSTMAAVTTTGTDCFGKKRTFQVENSSKSHLLKDSALNVETYDFKGKDPDILFGRLPGTAISDPPMFSESAVSAHANACDVSRFMRNILMRNNIDGVGGAMISTINCIVVSQSEQRLGKEWINAYWDGKQMVYGLRLDGSRPISMSAALDVVAHEMEHGVTDRSARLEYRFQSGALNESYSDILGVIVNNFSESDQSTWSWGIGAGLLPDGRPFRNLADPRAERQPDHMRDFVVLPDTENGDHGGVHSNSGIHNKAAHSILVARRQGRFLFMPREVAILFHLALTQFLSRTSQFSDSRRAVIQAARTFFRTLSTSQLSARIKAIEKAFEDVGIV